MLYWALQFLGWGAVFSLGLLSEYFVNGRVEWKTLVKVITMLLFVVFVTHFYRAAILKLGWLNKSIAKVVPRALIGAIVLSIIITSFKIGANYFILPDFKFDSETLKSFLGGMLSYFVLTTIWTIVYFGYHYFDKSRLQEVKNLQLESSQKESELSNLKNQLNPHFMFNAMNSIRALVDEDPKLAKISITQLSNLLRNTLLLGKKRLVTVSDEIKIVHDYLALEKVRFEERLTFTEDVKPNTVAAFLPPLIVQTLVENAIKHGISKKAAGGTVAVYVSKLGDSLCVEVHNDGEYKHNNSPDVGIGLQNARKRLSILYGNNAALTIENYNNKVISKVILPFQTEITSRT